ncbi:hypothetical protein PV325_001289 [Microctonus aethiopoides]|nr:hypothetical protein PV325_001289 [Microctonus aethiopoides]
MILTTEFLASDYNFASPKRKGRVKWPPASEYIVLPQQGSGARAMGHYTNRPHRVPWLLASSRNRHEELKQEGCKELLGGGGGGGSGRGMVTEGHGCGERRGESIKRRARENGIDVRAGDGESYS